MQASRLLTRLDRDEPCDLIVLRGRRIVGQVVADGHFDGRIWAYLTDIPQSAAGMTGRARGDLGRIAAASRLLLCQTEELRCFLETWVPQACGRSVLCPPAVPEPGFPVPDHDRPHDPLRLVYTGKFAPLWNTLPMTRLPALLAERGIRAELHTVGDKIHEDPGHPEFHEAMYRALHGSTPGVRHHGGRPREEAMRIAAGCDLGLGWRDPRLDASLELSTKVLEFGALGLPVVLNRTPAHEALLGTDYPLRPRPGRNRGRRRGRGPRRPRPRGPRLAADRCRQAASRYTLTAAAGRWRAHLTRAFPPAPPPSPTAPARCGSASPATT
ncbi:hypothetical protein ACFQ3Z_37280 [Streptomyces nogalater]